MNGERLTLVLALIAGVLAVIVVIVVIVVWRRERRRAHVARLRHPASPPPVEITLDVSGPAPRWRLAVRPGVPTTAIDIVTYRPAGVEEPWISEPIVEPIVLEPGRSTLLPNPVFGPAAHYDVVIAWTVRHPAGDLQGSRTLSVFTGPGSSVAADRRPLAANSHASRAAWVPVVGAVALVLLLGVIAAAAWRLLDDDDDGNTVSITDGGPTTPPTLVDPTVSPSTEPPTTTPAPTVAPTTTTTTTDPTTTTTTSTSTTTTTVPPTDDGRQVLIRGRVEDCRFGSDCIIASFSLVGFTGSGEYVCEFDDGSRSVFRYLGDGAEDACATSGPSPSITIEVDGVRSATITREAPGEG